MKIEYTKEGQQVHSWHAYMIGLLHSRVSPGAL